MARVLFVALALVTYQAPAYAQDPAETPVYVVEVYEGRAFVYLSPEAAQEAAKALTPGKLHAIDPALVWEEPLTATKLGPFSLKDELIVTQAKEAPKTCAIEGFVLLTRGYPHFGDLQDMDGNPKDPTEPRCGSPVAFAELDCTLDAPTDRGVIVATPAKAKAPVVYQQDPTSLSQDGLGPVKGPAAPVKKAMDAVLAAFQATDEYTTKLAAATGEAKAQGEPLKTKVSITRFVAKGSSVDLYAVQIHLLTREGYAECGGDDVSVELMGFWRYDTKAGKLFPYGAPVEAAYTKVALVIDPKGDGLPMVLVKDDLQTDLLVPVGDSLGTAYTLELPSCDCGC